MYREKINFSANLLLAIFLIIGLALNKIDCEEEQKSYYLKKGIDIQESPRILPILQKVVTRAAAQYSQVLVQNPTQQGLYPHTGKPDSSVWDGLTDYSRWTSGFYPGVLWELYRITGEVNWLAEAVIAQEGLKRRANDTGTHDVGFVIMSSFGLGYLSTGGNDEWADLIVQAAHSLATRFVPKAGVIRSWNSDDYHPGKPGEVSVIIDNMMNLDLLYTAGSLTGNETFFNIADSHADKTRQNHFRPEDFSTYHVIEYSEVDGSILRRHTHQGWRDNSTWARGQAWAIAGYAESYWWTLNSDYLRTSEKAAETFLSRLPQNMVPFWDFDAGDVAHSTGQYEPRDTSAATIAAYGLFQLYLATLNETYLRASERIVEFTLGEFSSEVSGAAIPAILVNGTVNKNENNMDTAIIYGDFYLLKYINLYNIFLG